MSLAAEPVDGRRSSPGFQGRKSSLGRIAGGLTGLSVVTGSNFQLALGFDECFFGEPLEFDQVLGQTFSNARRGMMALPPHAPVQLVIFHDQQLGDTWIACENYVGDFQIATICCVGDVESDVGVGVPRTGQAGEQVVGFGVDLVETVEVGHLNERRSKVSR
jgi:hypothetical protein